MISNFLENDELIIFCSVFILFVFLVTALLITWISRDNNTDTSDSES